MSQSKLLTTGLAVALVAAMAAAVYVAVANEDDTPVMKCNGLAELCDRRVDQATFAGTHNSMAAAKDGWKVANQDNGIPAQLEAGIRALLIDAQYWETDRDVVGQQRSYQNVPPQAFAFLRDLNATPQPGPMLCHTFCALGHERLADGLAEIRQFLDANRNEVLIVIVEDAITTDDMDAAMRESGLLKYVFVYDQRNRPPWPTLRQLIERDERLVMFYESGRGPGASWYLPAWQYVQDTSFRYADIAAFDCMRNRGLESNSLLLVNHWLSAIIPDRRDAAQANRYDVLERRVETCREERERMPNIIAVDYAETGDLLHVVRELNQRPR